MPVKATPTPAAKNAKGTTVQSDNFKSTAERLKQSGSSVISESSLKKGSTDSSSQKKSQTSFESMQKAADAIATGATQKSPVGAIAKQLTTPQSSEDVINTAAQQLGQKGLQIAWEAVIPTFGLSLLWIAFHLVMSLFFKNKWCQLGEEWGGSPTGAIHWMELIFFLAIFLLWLMIIGAAIMIIIIIASCAASPVQCTVEAFRTYFE